MHAEVDVRMCLVTPQCLLHSLTLAISFDFESELIDELDFIWVFSGYWNMWHEYFVTLSKETEHLLLEAKLRNRKVNLVEESDEMVNESLLEKSRILLLRRLGKSSCEVQHQVVDCKLKDFGSMCKLNIEVEQS